MMKERIEKVLVPIAGLCLAASILLIGHAAGLAASCGFAFLCGMTLSVFLIRDHERLSRLLLSLYLGLIVGFMVLGALAKGVLGMLAAGAAGLLAGILWPVILFVGVFVGYMLIIVVTWGRRPVMDAPGGEHES
jgi:hypothetical protein